MSESFQMIPAGTKPLWILLPVLVLLVGVVGMLGVALYASQNVRFEVSEAGLRLRGDIYGRLIPAASLRGGAAQIIDLGRAPEYRAKWRRLGTGLPGYYAGWFRLRNGEKALLFVTDPTQVVYIPTRDNYTVLLSVARPTAFLEAVRRIAPGS